MVPGAVPCGRAWRDGGLAAGILAHVLLFEKRKRVTGCGSRSPLPAVRPVGTRSPPLAGGGPGGASVSTARGADSRRVIRRVLAKTTSVATADKSPAVWQGKMSGRRTEQVGYLPTPMGATSEAGTCLTRTPSSPLMSYEGHLL